MKVSTTNSLVFSDMQRWQRWQRRRTPISRRARNGVDPRRRTEPELTITRWGAGDAPVVLVALDSASPSQIPALIDPARHLMDLGAPVAVLAPVDAGRAISQVLPSAAQAATRIGPNGPQYMKLSAVLSAGDHLAAGRLALGWARSRRVPYVVVQHGILTPYAPPLPPDAHLLAWSEQDARFWRGSRIEMGEVVGSQLLWRATQNSRATRARSSPTPTDSVTFLGQLHGFELPRKLTRRSVAALNARAAVVYRPHPGERDVASRVQHRLWSRQGITVANGFPLDEVGTAVLAHFSTGILEAAAVGLPAYAYCADPPGWLGQLWERYQMAQWGESEPTRFAALPQEPAAAIAAYVQEVQK